MNTRGKIFFASDFHLGLKAGNPAEREKEVVKWLNASAPEAAAFYLLGDVFDFWWEYHLVVPKGFTRFLGTVASITDSGIPVHFFTGNHDMWTNDYLSSECGMIIHKEPSNFTFDGKIFHLAHGEGLGSGNKAYHILLKIFRNKPLQKLYSALHPSIGMGIGHRWSLNSRLGKGISLAYLGEEKEDLVKYARSVLKTREVNYFIFGHRHLEKRVRLGADTEMIMMGDWITRGNYLVWDGTELQQKSL